MILEEGISNWVRQQAALTGVLLEGSRLRFFKLTMPQKSKLPSTVIQRVSTARQMLQCRPDKAVEASFLIDHYGADWQTAANLAELFRVTLQAEQFPAMMGEVKVKAATLENEIDLEDPEPGIFRRSQSWSFWFAES